MKSSVLLLAAAFILSACDGKKVEEAKQKTLDAAKSIGDAAREVSDKAIAKGGELKHQAGDKLKLAAGAAQAVMAGKGGEALEGFKAKLGGLTEWFQKARGQAGEDPSKANQLMSEMMAKVKSISPDGLPQDLKSAFEGYQNAMGRVDAVSKNLPVDAAAAEAWYKANAGKLDTLEADVAGAFKLLKAAAAKHGVTGLDLGTE